MRQCLIVSKYNMGKIQYVVGFTDQPYDGLVIDDDTESKKQYNLRKFKPSIENASISWTLADSPVIQGLLNTWEQVIRRPHLLWCGTDTTDNQLLHGEDDYQLSWEYIPLVPYTTPPYVLSQADFSDIESGQHKFGDLYLSYYTMASRINDAGFNSWASAVHSQSTVDLIPGPPVLEAIPGFTASFKLQRQAFGFAGLTPFQKKWMAVNQASLVALGYDPYNPACTIGDLCVGHLDTDAVEAREILKKYPYMCRHSIVSEDMHKKKDDNE